MSERNDEKKKVFLVKLKTVLKTLFWRDKVMAGVVYTGLLLNGVVWIGLYKLFQGVGDNNFIGHYNSFFGIDVILIKGDDGVWFDLFAPAIGGLIFFIFSICLSIFFMLQLDLIVSGNQTKKKSGVDNFVSNEAIGFLGSRMLLIGGWLLQWILIVYLLAIWRINYL